MLSDSAGNVVYTAHTILERADSSTERPPWWKAVGIILAVMSGLLIGISFIFKKKGLLKANAKYHEEAGEGYGYLKNAWWWSGMTLMILGEICNFVAYVFVDAIVVTSMGALSVVVTTILSAIFLKERLSFVGKIGCFNCIIGATVIALNAPQQPAAANITEMQHYMITPGFLTYAGVVIVACLVIVFWAGPRYGKNNMFVYLSVCSLIGGLSVSALQGLDAAIVTQIGGTPQFNHWFLYVLLVFVVCTLVTEILYLNKALNIFNAALVTPTYYVYFTSSTIVTSAILFQGFKGTVVSIMTFVMGFLVVCSGVILLQLAKSSKDIPDTAVFNGDLDQVRTMAEQEEPEFEPRADTLRGGAGILRVLSKRRTAREAEEAKTIYSDSMAPIREDEVVEWDGLRRRKTVLTPNQPSIRRTKTIHPPLGHTNSSFHPDDISEADTDGLHPGFLPRFGRSSTRTTASTRRTSPSPVPMSGITISPNKATSAEVPQREHIYGLPAGLRKNLDGTTADADDNDLDTSYHGSRDVSSTTANTEHIHFDVSATNRPPRPPPHVQGANTGGTRRHFSFQNVLHPHRAKSNTTTTPSPVQEEQRKTSYFSSPSKILKGVGSGAGAGAAHGEYGYSSPKPSRAGTSGVSEEERLGLVQGDSRSPLVGRPDPARRLGSFTEEADEYDDEGGQEEWERIRAGGGIGSGGESPVRVARGEIRTSGPQARRHRDSLDSDDDDFDDDHEADALAYGTRPTHRQSVL